MPAQSMRRTIAGLAVAPIVPGALIAGAMFVLAQGEDAVSVLQANVLFGYPVAFLLGVPGHVLLMRSGWTAWTAYAAAGALLGAAVYAGAPAVIETIMRLQGVDASGHLTFSATLLPVAMICATLAAVSFWLIVRPDRAVARR